MPKIVIYSTQTCPYCDRAKALLDKKGVTYQQILIDADPAQRDVMLEKSGGRRTVPQIFIDKRHVGGFDDLHAADSTGELDKWLTGESS